MAIKSPGNVSTESSAAASRCQSAVRRFHPSMGAGAHGGCERPRLSGFDAPIDQIWVSPDRKYTRRLDLGKASDLWKAANQRKALSMAGLTFRAPCRLYSSR